MKLCFISLVLIFLLVGRLVGQTLASPIGTLIHPNSTEYLNLEPRTNFTPWPDGTFVLKLEADAINLNDLKKYYRYPNVRRLDQLCTAFLDFEHFEKRPKLQEIAFPYYYLVTATNDTFSLSQMQFVLGNLRTEKNHPNVLLISNFVEGWGYFLDALSLNEEGAITDIERICQRGGDGGDRSELQLKYKNSGFYEWTEAVSHQYYTNPVDSIETDYNYGYLRLYDNGNFDRYLTGQDSNQMVRFPAKN